MNRWGGIFAIWLAGTIIINYVVPGFAYLSGYLAIPALLVYLVVFGRYGLIAKYRKPKAAPTGEDAVCRTCYRRGCVKHQVSELSESADAQR